MQTDQRLDNLPFFLRLEKMMELILTEFGIPVPPLPAISTIQLATPLTEIRTRTVAPKPAAPQFVESVPRTRRCTTGKKVSEKDKEIINRFLGAMTTPEEGQDAPFDAVAEAFRTWTASAVGYADVASDPRKLGKLLKAVGIVTATTRNAKTGGKVVRVVPGIRLKIYSPV
jgi:hypothetical protein